MTAIPHVVIVVGSLARAGAEGQIVEFVRAAHPARAKCTVVCLTNPGARSAEVQALGAEVVSLGLAEGSPGRISKAVRAVRRSIRLGHELRRLRPDVVYAFLGLSYALALPLSAVVTRDSTRVAALRAVARTEGNRLLDGPGSRLGLWFAHGAIANSAETLPSWFALQPRLRGRTHVVRNGVSQRPAREHGTGSRVRIVCVASLKPIKDHATLLRAVGGLDPKLKWELRLAGDGPLNAELRRQAVELGVAERVTFLGECQNVDAELSRADIAVLCSRNEGTPNAVVEAMAHGLPVVATRVGGLPSLLGEGGGRLVPPGDHMALRAAVAELIHNHELRARLGAAGRMNVQRHFSIERLRDETFAALDAIARGRHRDVG